MCNIHRQTPCPAPRSRLQPIAKAKSAISRQLSIKEGQVEFIHTRLWIIRRVISGAPRANMLNERARAANRVRKYQKN
jgi:hypothetical protein